MSINPVRRDGTLVINPTSADDGGFFTCEVSNGIGEPQKATAYLNVECEYNSFKSNSFKE